MEVRGQTVRGQRGSPTLKMQGMSFLVAWITSDAKTELTENSSSLKQKQEHVSRVNIIQL